MAILAVAHISNMLEICIHFTIKHLAQSSPLIHVFDYISFFVIVIITNMNLGV